MIENYKDLLRTIFVQDNKEAKVVICVYDTKDSDKLVAVFGKTSYCANFFATTKEVINCNISRKTLRNKRYRIERVEL